MTSRCFPHLNLCGAGYFSQFSIFSIDHLNQGAEKQIGKALFLKMLQCRKKRQHVIFIHDVIHLLVLKFVLVELNWRRV